jgi:hypothetical protein
MRFPKRLAVVSSVVLVVVLCTLAAVFVGRGRRAAGRGTAEATAAAAPGGLTWREGVQTLYSLDWTAGARGELMPAQQGAPNPANDMVVDTVLEAGLALEPIGRRGDLETVAFSLTSLEKFSVRMMGNEGVPDLAAAARELVGPAAFASFDARGQVREIRYEESASPAAQQTLRAIVQLFQLARQQGAEAEWDAVESGASGQLAVRYKGDRRALVRSPLRYQSLDAVQGPLDGRQVLEGETRIALDDDGQLEQSRGFERLAYTPDGAPRPAVSADMTFQLTRTGRRASPGVLLAKKAAARPPQPLSAHPKDPGLDARRDARMAAYLDEDKLSQEIDHHQGGAKSDHSFLARAGAWLRLHPEGAKALAARFQLASTNALGRGFILDLLAEAGDANAQAAMREALMTAAAAEQGGGQGVLLQRFTWVKAPDAASARFLAQVMTSKQSSLAATQGAAVALGAVVNKLRLMGHEDLAQAYNRELVSSLKDTGEVGKKRALLSALGNAAREENVPTLLEYVGDAEPGVREQAASALRSVDSKEAAQGLLKLAADPLVGVSTLALRSLSQQTLGDGEWGELKRLAEAGRTNSSADTMFIQLVRKQREAAGASGDEILRALLRRNQGGENDVGEMIEQLLARGG